MKLRVTSSNAGWMIQPYWKPAVYHTRYAEAVAGPFPTKKMAIEIVTLIYWMTKWQA